MSPRLLERDALIFAAAKGGASPDVIARQIHLSLRRVQEIIKLGHSGHLAQKLADAAARNRASENSVSAYPYSLHRPRRQRKTARRGKL